MAGSNDKGLAISAGTRYGFGGQSGPVYDESDANANMLKFDMEPGDATHVPGVLFGVDIMGVDLGMFDGRTEPVVGVVDLDGDSAVTLGFTSDDVATIILGGNATLVLPTAQAGNLTFADETVDIGTSSIGLNDLHFGSGGVINFDNSDVTWTHAANKLTMAGGDLHVADGNGVVIGHTAQIPLFGLSPELQVLGTTQGADSALLLGLWNTTNNQAARLLFIKSGNATIGSNTIVADNEALGFIKFFADDGADYQTEPADIVAEVDDAAPAANNIGGALVFRTQRGVSTDDLTETLRLTAAGDALFAGNVVTSGGAANGQAWSVKVVTGTHSAVSGTGTETIASVIPAGAIVLGVTTRVTTILAGTGLTTWSIGLSGDTDRWGTGIALAANTTTDGTDFAADVQPTVYPSATSIVLTAAAGQFDSGVVRYTIHYYDFTAATS